MLLIHHPRIKIGTRLESYGHHDGTPGCNTPRSGTLVQSESGYWDA